VEEIDEFEPFDFSKLPRDDNTFTAIIESISYMGYVTLRFNKPLST
jgi:hypothetical protein